MAKFQSAEQSASIADGPAQAIVVQPSPPPFRVDEGGVVRVGNSRVSLDVVVEQYENGMAAEDLVRAYDSLELADVHATIAYYLRHKAQVQHYLQQRREQAAAQRAKIEAERPRISRDELAVRRGAAETGDAPAGR